VILLLSAALYVGYYWLLFMEWKEHAPDLLDVRHVTVRLRGLHPSLHGLKIAQLSDLHFNDGNSFETGVTDATLRAAIKAVNAAEVDLVALTGDFVDHWPQAAHPLARRWLAQLRTGPQGVAARGPEDHSAILASLGNHDFQKPGSQAAVTAALRGIGVTVLQNEATLPLHDATQRPWLEVVGLGDYWTHAYRPADVMGPRPLPHYETAIERNRRTWHYVEGAGDSAGARAGAGAARAPLVVRNVAALPPPPSAAAADATLARRPGSEAVRRRGGGGGGEEARGSEGEVSPSPAGDPYRRVRIVLSHNPDTAAELAQWGEVDLVLAGHTHGGLSCFPPAATWIVRALHALIPERVLRTLPIPGINAVRHFAHTFGLSAVLRRVGLDQEGEGAGARETNAGAGAAAGAGGRMPAAAAAGAAPAGAGAGGRAAGGLRGPAPMQVYTNAGLTRGHPARWLCNAEVVILHLQPDNEGSPPMPRSPFKRMV
jgi:predicted MPP superfamily phosphohydrolase